MDQEEISSSGGSEGFEEYSEESEGQMSNVSSFGTIMNLLNSMLGAGILTVPYSMKFCGLIISVIMLFGICFISFLASVLTVKLQEKKQAKGLDELVQMICGNIPAKIVSVMVLLFCLSALVAYLIIASDNIISWLNLAGMNIQKDWQRILVVIIYSILIPAMLTVPKQIKILSYFSFGTVACIILFFIVMIIKSIIVLPNGISPNIKYASFGMDFFSSINLYSLTFALPIILIPLITPYKKPQKKKNKVIAISAIACFILVIVPGILGYLMNGDILKDNILNSYKNNDILIILVRIGFFIVVTFSYPCVAVSILATASYLIFKENQPIKLPYKKRIIILIITNAIPILLAVSFKNISSVMEVGGSLGGCIVDFFFPPLMCFLESKKKWYHHKNILYLIFAGFGIIIGLICTVKSIFNAVATFTNK